MVFPWVFPWFFPWFFPCGSLSSMVFPLFLGRLLVKNDHKTPTRTDSVNGQMNLGFFQLVEALSCWDDTSVGWMVPMKTSNSKPTGTMVVIIEPVMWSTLQNGWLKRRNDRFCGFRHVSSPLSMDVYGHDIPVMWMWGIYQFNQQKTVIWHDFSRKSIGCHHGKWSFAAFKPWFSHGNKSCVFASIARPKRRRLWQLLPSRWARRSPLALRISGNVSNFWGLTNWLN